jgi:uncharacterized protein (TIGR02246 family)
MTNIIWRWTNILAKSKFILPAIIIGTLTACATVSPPTAAPTPDQSAAVQAIMGKYNQCFSQMDANCISLLYTPDGEIYSTGLLQASGLDAIRSFMHQSFNNARIDSFTATINSIIINGEDAVVIGTTDEKTTNTANQSTEAKMQYITEWIGQPNGQWLLKRFNTEVLP